MIMKRISDLLMCVGLSCVLLAGCDKYDDTEIRESIKDLEKRIEELEEKVADNVAALQSMVSLGSVRSVSMDAGTGKMTVTMLDGSKMIFDQELTGYSLLTVEEDENGEYHWAVCEDGGCKPLLVDGKKVPVVVTPALELSEDGEWMISADGGKTWVSTGIHQEKCECTPADGNVPINPEEPSVSFFRNVELDGDLLLLTLMDGTVVKVSVVGEPVFSTSSETLWFAKESVDKMVVLEMNDVKAFTITEKPEGWKARIEDSNLIVTSPDDISQAASSGEIKILGLFNGGNNPEIVTVEVVYEEPLTLRSGGEASFTVKLSDHALEDIEGYVTCIWKAADFTPEAAVAWLNSEEGLAVECHTETATFDLETMIPDYSQMEAYVAFVAEHIPVKQLVSGNMSYRPEDLMVVELGTSLLSARFTDIRYDSAMLHVEFNEMTEYYGGFFESGFWEAIGRDNVLESLNQGNMTPLTASVYDGEASLFPDGVAGTQILPSTEYVVWVAPVSETGTYTEEDFILCSFTSAPVMSDESVEAPSCEVTEVTYGGFSAKVTPAPGTYKTYAAIRNASAVPEDLMQSVTELIDINTFSSGQDVLSVSSNSFSENDEVYLLAVSLMQDGRFGTLYKEKVELRKLVYSDDMSVSLSTSCHGLGDVTVAMNFTGDPSTVTYYCTSNNYFSDEALQDMLAKGQVGDAVNDVKVSGISEGKVTLTGLSLGVEHTFYALVKDADGNPSKMYKKTFIPIIMVNYITEGMTGYEYGMPQVEIVRKLSTYNMTVSMPDNCVTYWMFTGDFEYMTGSSTMSELVDVYSATDNLLTMKLEAVGATVHTSSQPSKKITVRNTTRIYVAWLDDKGEYHAVHVINPNSL